MNVIWIQSVKKRGEMCKKKKEKKIHNKVKHYYSLAKNVPNVVTTYLY